MDGCCNIFTGAANSLVVGPYVKHNEMCTHAKHYDSIQSSLYDALARCGLATSYGHIGLGRYWFRLWLVVTRSIFLKILTKDTRYGVSFVGSLSTLYDVSGTVAIFAISCHIGSRYNGTRLNNTFAIIVSQELMSWFIMESLQWI